MTTMTIMTAMTAMTTMTTMTTITKMTTKTGTETETLRVSDLQSDRYLDSICNTCDV